MTRTRRDGAGATLAPTVARAVLFGDLACGRFVHVVASWLEQRGWSVVGPRWGSEGILVSVVAGDEDAGFVFVEGRLVALSTVVIPLSRDLARDFGTTVTCREVTATDRTSSDAECVFPRFETRERSFDMSPRGEVENVAPIVCEPSYHLGGAEVRDAALRLMIHDGSELGERLWTARLVRGRPELNGRLADLAQTIELVGAWCIERRDDGWGVAIEGAAIGKRWSTLSDLELIRLKRAVSVAPREVSFAPAGRA